MESPNIFFENYFNDFTDLFLEVGETVMFKKGDTISSLDKNQYIYYIKDGIFLLYLEHEKGEHKAFCYHAAGSLNPYSLARPKKGNYKIELDYFVITAITEIKAIRIKPKLFHSLMLEHPTLAIAMLDYVIDHSNLYLYESLRLSYNSAFSKTCNFVYVYTQHLMKKGIALSQSDIGAFIGETRLSVARSLKTLREMNVVNTSRNKITVLDMNKLIDLANNSD